MKLKKTGYWPREAFVLLAIIMFTIACQALTIPFVATNPMGNARRYNTATLLANGKVLVAGGDDDRGHDLASAELYDPSNETWTATGSMKTARRQHMATLLPNGKVLVASGTSNGVALASAELYDPSTGTWTETGAMGSKRFNSKMALLSNGKVLVANGASTGGAFSSCELYNPSTGIWTYTGELWEGKQNAAMIVMSDGMVQLSGGITWFTPPTSSTVERYDPSEGRWTSFGNMTTGRRDHTATLLSNGTVLVAGGVNVGGGRISSCELLASGNSSSAGSMGTVRSLHTAILLPDTKVLVFGDSTVSELYKPSNKTWTTTGSRANSNPNLIATLLPNGKVLVTGDSTRTDLYGCMVTFNADGGTVSQSTKTYYDGNDSYGVLPVPTRAFYVFGGWWTGASGTGTQVTSGTALTAASDHTLYAKWTPILTSQGVPWFWLDSYGIVSSGDFEAAAETDSDVDGYLAWQEYLAGSDPTNKTSVLKAMIGVDGSNPLISWSPDLRPNRIYTVVGKTNLTDAAWGPTNTASRFFKVQVDMP